MSNVTKITVNGRDYDSVEQMPPEVREEYLQAMAALRKAGAFQTPGPGKKGDVSHTVVRETITFNGRVYQSRDELPPEARALLAQMPEPSPDTPATELEIKTVKTFPSETFVVNSLGDGQKAPEQDPRIAWLLVTTLTVIVVILLFLLYLAGARRWHGRFRIAIPQPVRQPGVQIAAKNYKVGRRAAGGVGAGRARK